MFSPPGERLERGWPGRIDGEHVVQLAAQTLQSFFTGGGGAREHAVYRLADVDLRPPVLSPPSVRLFTAWSGAAGGPRFSFRAPAPVLGPGDALPFPAGVEELDFGLGLAAMIGADGAIGGFTLANDWTARDLERSERAAGLGPSKSKDFGLSLGPVLVTPDELDGVGLAARVNGVERRRATAAELPGAWDDLVEHAGRGSVLRPGDVLVVAAGGDVDGGRLVPGDEVELQADGIGSLRCRIGPRKGEDGNTPFGL